MKLAQWIDQAGISRAEFGRKIGVTPGYMTALCAGAAWPRAELMRAILKATKGAVTPTDLMQNDKREKANG